MSPFDDDAQKRLPDDDDPDQLLADAQRLRQRQEMSPLAAIYLQKVPVCGVFDREPISCDLTLDDHRFLSALGIGAPERTVLPEPTYVARSIEENALERLMRPAHFGIRLTHLYDAMTALERAHARPCAAEYLRIIHNAFYTSELCHLEPGALSVVEGEIDALAAQDPATLIASERCATLLARADPTLFRLYTASPGWTAFGLGGA